jgi:DNA-binding winged helix-turn-helix (wHTH) protein
MFGELRKFANFVVNLTTEEIFSDGSKVGMESKVFQMLGLLLRCPGQLVTFDQLKTAIWPDVTVELKENCHVLANKLRVALGEVDKGKPYVVNERGKGYYFSREVDVECFVLSPPHEEPAGMSPASAPRARATLGTTVWKWAVPIVALVIVSVVGAALRPRAQLHDFRIQGRDVIALDATDRELWRHSFPADLLNSVYDGDGRRRHSWVGRLTQREADQLLFNVFPVQNITFESPVVLFRSDGRIAWEFIPGRTVVDGNGEMMSPPYHPNSLLVVQGKRSEDTRIVVSSNHYLGQANQIALLNPAGQIVGEYWHPGHLLHLAQKDLDGDGRNELLLGGVNNGEHQATLVILDPLKSIGISTPKQMKDNRFALMNLPASEEEAVILFPRSCISKGQPYTRVSALNVTGERITVDVSESVDPSGRGFIYEFDFGLRVISVTPDNGVLFARKHDELQTAGKLNHRLDIEKECAALKKGVVVKRRGNGGRVNNSALLKSEFVRPHRE